MTARPLRPGVLADPGAALAALGAVVSPDLDAYVSGALPLSRVRCVLCKLAPCQCPPFGTPGYFALTDACHGRGPVPLSDDPAARCPAACGHPLTVHSADLGCWLCDCTHGRERSSGPVTGIPAGQVTCDTLDRPWTGPGPRARPAARGEVTP